MSSNRIVYKDWTTTFLLAFCLPGFERFYLGCPMSGLLKCCTCAGCGIWWLIDLFRLSGGSALCANLHGKLQYLNGPTVVVKSGANNNFAKGGGNNNANNSSDAQNDYFYMIFSTLLGVMLFYYLILPMYRKEVQVVEEEEIPQFNNMN